MTAARRTNATPRRSPARAGGEPMVAPSRSPGDDEGGGSMRSAIGPEELRMSTRHAIQVQPAGAAWAAVCSCGWTGEPRSAWNMARHDGTLHVELARPAPPARVLAHR